MPLPRFIVKAILTVLLVLVAVPACAASILRIQNVTLVDVETGALKPAQDVLVRGDRIISIQQTGGHDAADVTLDGRGKFLIPGLWDCHVHLSWTTDAALPLLIAQGITSVRDLGSALGQIEGWRARIAAGDLVGPRILRVGPILNGKAFNAYQFVPGSVEGTRATVRLLAGLGVDEIKVHRCMPKDWYLAAIDEARSAHLRVVGHVPMEVSPAQASEAGQYMIEHTETLFEGTFAKGLEDAQMPDAIRAWLASDAPETLAATFRKNGTWLDPTLSGYLEMVDLLDLATPADPRCRYVAAWQCKILTDQMKAHPQTPAEVATLHAHMNLLVDVTARLQKAGVRMVAGTDAAAYRLVGFSLHKEQADLVRAGMTPLKALQTATLNPAIAFDRCADLGTLAPGKLADMVLLRGNPLENIDSTRAIAAVIAGGHLYGPVERDRLMRESAALAAIR